MEWDPETAWIVQLLFETAQAKGWGQTRLARYLNEHPDTEKFRPFHGATVGYWLDNAIYIGELSWDKHATDIIDDVRVIQKNAEEIVLRIPDFCEPLIAKATWDEVQALRNARRSQLARARQRDSAADKQMKPLAPGMTLNYPLSGLVRCGTCQLSMVVSPSPAYITKSGDVRRYTAYFCAADCGNGIRVPEAWLRQTVFGTASDRLFLDRDPEERRASLALLIDEVRKELARMSVHELDHRPALEQEHKELLEQRQGWTLSLSKPNLHPAVRESVEQQMAIASDRQEDIESKLTDLDAQESSHANCLDEATILERLDRMPEILSAQNPTRMNIELSLHIDRIECFSDGRVLMRTCRLGALAPIAKQLRVDASASPGTSTANGEYQAKPRRRTRRRVDDPIGEEGELKAAAEFAADPNRFSGIEEQWFWTDEFQIPKRQSWAQENSIEVAEARAKGWTMERVASHFGKTVPTIRAALHYACAYGSFQELPDKMPRRRWHEDHASEVVALKAKGMTTVEIAKHFKKSDTTIRAALTHAEGSQVTDTAP